MTRGFRPNHRQSSVAEGATTGLVSVGERARGQPADVAEAGDEAGLLDIEAPEREVVERDRETTARALAETEFLAREIAGVRIALEQKADREDLLGPIEQLTHAIERLHGVRLIEDDDVDLVEDAGDYPVG